MKFKYAFVSEHEPSEKHRTLAAERHIEIIHVGDVATFSAALDEGRYFDKSADFYSRKLVFDGVIIDHPAAALVLQLACSYDVGMFAYDRCDRIGDEQDPEPI